MHTASSHCHRQSRHWGSTMKEDWHMCVLFICLLSHALIQLIKIILTAMQPLDRIFQSKLAQLSPDARMPVTSSLLTLFHTQKSLVESAQARKESTENKNRKIAEEGLKYRNQLQQKLAQLQKKHASNRRDALNKIVKSEERRKDYRREIYSRHREGERKSAKEKAGLLREYSEKMQEYWRQKKEQTDKSFRSQTAVRPVYPSSVERKKSLEQENCQLGEKVKSGLLRRHEGRQELVHQLHQRKQEQLHQPHSQKIDEVLRKSATILDAKIASLINNIGSDFSRSQLVLDGNTKAQTKRFSDRRIDDYDHRSTVRSNLMERMRQRASSLSECQCKRINNVEEGSISPLVKEESRHLYFGDTLRKLEREPSLNVTRHSQYLTRSQSFRSTVCYNKQMLSQRVHIRHSDRLRHEREITESLALRKAMQVEGNCQVRKSKVK